MKKWMTPLLILLSLLGISRAPILYEGKRVAVLGSELVRECEGFVDGKLTELTDYDFALVLKVQGYAKEVDRVAAKVCLAHYDLSGPAPRLMHQKTFKWKHPLPKGDHLIDYSSLTTSEYAHTPLAVAENRLQKDLIQSISEIIHS